MKKNKYPFLLLVLISCFFSVHLFATIHTYASSSILASGRFAKIGVTETGIHKISYDEIVELGIDPNNVHIYGFGGEVLNQSFSESKNDDLPEVPIWIAKGDDGVFGKGDYVLFYGKGVVKWTLDRSLNLFTHENNPYGNQGYYFISSNSNPVKSVNEKIISVPSGVTVNAVNQFIDYRLYEKDLVCLPKGGRDFYGEEFSNITSYDFPFNFPNIVTGTKAKVFLDVAANSASTSSFSLKLNGTMQSSALSVPAIGSNSGNYIIANGVNSILSFTPSSDNLSFNLSYDLPTTISIGYLNYMEVTVRRNLVMTGSFMQFQNIDYLNTGQYSTYTLSNANSSTQIWDITDPQNVSRIKTVFSNGTLSFTDTCSTLKQYVAVNTTAGDGFLAHTKGAIVPNQDLHKLSDVEMVILTHPDFVTQANKLADAHLSVDTMTVEVVTTEQVYNEFSSGTPDATAYRWLMKMLYDKAGTDTAKRPKYLLLFGRGTYDNKKILNDPDSGDSYILTYQAENSLVVTSAYVTDDYFTFLEDHEGTNLPAHTMDIGVGRFPVATTQQATDVVNKVINYMKNEVKGNWKNQLCFLADDGDAAEEGTIHMKQANECADYLIDNYPSYTINKILTDAFPQETSASGQSYPLAKNKLQNLLNSGLFYLSFTGHGSPVGWTSEKMLQTADVQTLTNKCLPFWWGATCDFMQFDKKAISGGEQVLLNPVGGGIGMVSAARPVYADQNFLLHKSFCNNFLAKKDGKHLRIGDVLMLTKNQIGNNVNKLPYVYMGDPAIKLNYAADYQIKTTKINNTDVTSAQTLNALTVATVEGYIADELGDTVKSFNGSLSSTVFDKVQTISTLNNDKTGAFSFTDRSNKIFAGNAKVNDGKFSFMFMLPKDIKLNLGSGLINYYANDDVNKVEAQGCFENFIVGGINESMLTDTQGPTIAMYINDSLATNNKVNETPVFMASISDVNGINTVGTGIGHDILLTIDKDPNKSYVLNDNFIAATNSYKSGNVKFKMPEMTDGMHTLTLKAFDLMNNSTSKTISFEVIKGLAPVVFSVSNYPNPVVTETRFIVRNDRPDILLNSTVEVFDIAGRLIWKSLPLSGVDNLSWDLKSNTGQKVMPGIYFYRINVKAFNSEYNSKTSKMIVVEK